MSELFEVYQSNLKDKFTEVSKNLEIIKEDPNQELINKIETDLKECDKLIKTLEIQISTSPDPNYSLYVKNFKGGYENYRKKFKIEREKFKEKQNSNMISLSTDNSIIPKASLNEEIAYKSFTKLEQAHRTTLGIEGIGNEVMMEMYEQSENMKGITEKVKNVGDKITTSSSLISEMDKRHKKNKFIVIIFGSILVIIFFAILVFRFIPFSRGSSSTPEISSNSTIALNTTTGGSQS